VVCTAAALPALAGPFGVRLTEAADPATTMAVAWNSDDAADVEVHFGTTAGTLDQVRTADVVTMPDGLGTAFTVVLTGLEPATRSHYRVGHGATLYPAAGDAPFSFATLDDDPCAELRFIVAGDNRANVNTGHPGTSDLWPEILGEAIASEPALLV